MAVIVNGQFVEDERFIEAFRQLGGFEIDTTTPGGRSQANALRRLSERQGCRTGSAAPEGLGVRVYCVGRGGEVDVEKLARYARLIRR